MNVNYSKRILVTGVIATVVLLPSCAIIDSFRGKSSEEASVAQVEMTETQKVLPGEVIATMNGKPIITSGTLEIEKENIFKSNPQLKAALAFMPDPKVLDRNLTDGLVSQMVVDEEVIARGFDQTPEYKAELADAYKAIKRMLNAKYFGQTIKVSISDDEARSFYEANKDTLPGLLLSQGGVVTSGIQFDSENAARDFMTRVKADRNDFTKVAQQEGIADSIKDFRMVNNNSVGIDPVLRDKIVAIKNTPTVEMMTAGDGSVWVIYASAKETPKYRAFEQIKDGIKQELEKNRRGELFEIEINKLKDKYNISVNEEYFRGPQGESEVEEEEITIGAPRGSATAQTATEREESLSKRLA